MAKIATGKSTADWRTDIDAAPRDDWVLGYDETGASSAGVCLMRFNNAKRWWTVAPGHWVIRPTHWAHKPASPPSRYR